MVVPLEKYSDLVYWMVKNKIQFSSLLTVNKSPLGGVGVFAREDIPEDNLLLAVPKPSILCPVNSGIANLLEDAQLDGMLGLTLAYMYERSLGKDSPWYEYLQTIEESGPDVAVIPKFWDPKEQELLTGTEVEYMGGLDAEEVSSVYEDEVKPFIESNNLFENQPKLRTYEAYRNALVAVSGRAFEVDVYRGLSLVPGACLFNHTNDEDVHFESQDAVCPVCGSANFCEHALDRMNEGYSDDEDGHAHSHSHGKGGCCSHSDDDFESDEDVQENGKDSHNHHSHSHADNSSQHSSASSNSNADVDIVEEPTELTIDGISDESEPEDNDEDYEDEDVEMEDGDSMEGDDEEEEEEEDEEDLDTCDIVAVKNIPANKEVYNSYGELSNGVLLSRYGFALWDNEHETVSLGKEVLDYVMENDFKKRTSWWSDHFYRIIFGIDPEEWSEDFYGDEEDDEEELAPPPAPDSITWIELLDLFSNGEPSPGLMAILYILSLTDSEYETFIAKADAVNYDSISFNNRGLTLLKKLLEKRATRYQDGNLTGAEYKKLLKTLGKNQQHQRLAVIVKGTEKLVIERTRKWTKKAGKF